MADLTLKQIKEVLKKELGPINKKLGGHGSQFRSISAKFDKHDNQFKSIAQKLDKHDNQFKSIAAKLDEHSMKLDSLTLDMVDVQKKTDVLKDIQSYIKDTKEKVDDHDERMQRLENAA